MCHYYVCVGEHVLRTGRNCEDSVLSTSQTQPGECPVDEGASNDTLPVTAVLPEAHS